MRRFGSIGDGVRAFSKVGAHLAAFALVASGCQLVTGTYTVDSLGPDCTSLASCCVSLSGSEQSMCVSAVTNEDETVCAALQGILVSGSCASGTKLDGGSSFPDGQAHHDGGMIILGDAFAKNDVFMRHDAPGSHDVFTQQDVVEPDDTGQDAPSDGLEGTWNLTAIACDGTAESLDGSTDTLTFTSGAVTEVNTSSGCVASDTFSPDTITDTDITATSDSTTCGTGCTSGTCTAGVTAVSLDLPYSLSGNTLTITETGTESCTTGALVFTFEKE